MECKDDTDSITDRGRRNWTEASSREDMVQWWTHQPVSFPHCTNCEISVPSSRLTATWCTTAIGDPTSQRKQRFFPQDLSSVTDEEGWRRVGDIPWFASVLYMSFSASTLLVGWQEGHPACKWTWASKYVSEWIYIEYCHQRAPNALNALVQITPNGSVLEQGEENRGKSRLILVHLAVKPRQQSWWYVVEICVVIVGLVRHWFLHSGQVSAGCSSVLHDAWP